MRAVILKSLILMAFLSLSCFALTPQQILKQHPEAEFPRLLSRVAGYPELTRLGLQARYEIENDLVREGTSHAVIITDNAGRIILRGVWNFPEKAGRREDLYDLESNEPAEAAKLMLALVRARVQEVEDEPDEAAVRRVLYQAMQRGSILALGLRTAYHHALFSLTDKIKGGGDFRARQEEVAEKRAFVYSVRRHYNLPGRFAIVGVDAKLQEMKPGEFWFDHEKIVHEYGVTVEYNFAEGAATLIHSARLSAISKNSDFLNFVGVVGAFFEESERTLTLNDLEKDNGVHTLYMKPENYCAAAYRPHSPMNWVTYPNGVPGVTQSFVSHPGF